MSNNGKYGESLFSATMQSMQYKVQDVSNNPDYWYKDIDFIVTSPTTGAVKTFEVKWDSRINATGNLFLELTNVHSKGGKGWFNFCEADYLAYGDAIANCFYIIPIAALREKIKGLAPRYAYCGADSKGLLVSLKDIQEITMIL